MDSRHAPGGPTRPSATVLAVCVLGLSAAPSCAPPVDESGRADAVVDHQTAAARPASPSSSSTSSFTLFESGQVRPLALSPDGRHLFATNTPDNRLEIFRIEDHRLVHTGSIPVGLEPVAVAARTDREVWVVNHLSDSVSIVTLDDDQGDGDDQGENHRADHGGDAGGDDGTAGQVTRTLLVGDEPRDLVFAGPGRKR